MGRLEAELEELEQRLREAEEREAAAHEAAEALRLDKETLAQRVADVSATPARPPAVPVARRAAPLAPCARRRCSHALTLDPCLAVHAHCAPYRPVPPWVPRQAEKTLVEKEELFAQVHTQMQAQVEQMLKSQRR